MVIQIPGLTSIAKINYYASPQFKKGLFSSCKDVVFPEDNEKILNLLCGRSAETCTPQLLVEYMGSTSNGMSPFDIIFPEILPTNMSWMSSSTFKCNESFVNPWTNKTELQCSCQDCSASCPALPPVPSGPHHKTILGLRVLSVSLLLVYLAFLFTFIPISFYLIYRRRHRYARIPDGPDPISSNMPYTDGQPPNSLDVSFAHKPSCCEMMGFWMDKKLRQIFSRWGSWCSVHPFIVIAACIIFVGILAGGLKFYQVTKDPVKL